MKIKICCIGSIDEARLVVSSGAHALGFVSRTLGSARAIPDDAIRAIVEAAPAGLATVLLTSDTDPAEIAAHQRATRVNTLQLPGPIEPGSVRALRVELPGIRLVKVVHVEGPESIDVAKAYSDAAHVLLLDTKVESRDGVALGGTGAVHDWSISRRIVETSPLPVVLAGGLSPENVAEAVRSVSPAGVDVCSSLRPTGALDPDRLHAFVSAASSALA